MGILLIMRTLRELGDPPPTHTNTLSSLSHAPVRRHCHPLQGGCTALSPWGCDSTE